MKLSLNERELIRQAVREAEKSTSGEIVPVIVRETEGWFEVHTALLLGGIAVGSIAFALADHFALFGGWKTPSELLEFQTAGLFTGALLSMIAPLRRLLIPSGIRSAAVHRAAEAAFMANGLTETRDRTGILIFIALFEREVRILADRGIHQKVGDAYWKGHADRIAASVRDARFCEQLCDTIGDMGQRLAQHFPRRPDDVNELPDTPRIS